MARLFQLAWLGLLLALPASLPWLPELVGSPGKELPRMAQVLLMMAVTASLWLLSEPALRWMAKRHPGSINLPHRDYWLAPERREASLQRLAGLNACVGLLVLALVGGIQLHALLDHHPTWLQPPAWAWWLGAGLLHLGFFLVLWRTLRHFGKRPKDHAPEPSRRPRLPDRYRR
ncbi:hypothetical protein [Inhella sp.]|uniref:hypothetical protein n=1 Tax=Inhella sp. TaxID=1921806 RepID=UPI0035B2AFBD